MNEMLIEPGKYVDLTYQIFDDLGNLVEQHDLPIGFVYGSDTVLIGNMDQAIAGKKAGDAFETTLTPEEGYGLYDPALTFTDDIHNVPPQFHQVGAEVPMENDRGETKAFYVSEIKDGRLTIDGNHPLAGKTLSIKIKIVAVRDAMSGEDQVSGIHAIPPHPPHPTIN